MSVHQSKRGLDLPLAGAPRLQIDAAAPVAHVALLGADTIGLKPTLLVEPGATVRLGQPLYADKKNPGVQFTAPAAGRVIAVNRGARRAFVSLVIAVAPDETRLAALEFKSLRACAAELLTHTDVRALLLESGLWTALRTRPFGKVPAADAVPAALFVTAIDTRPHAPPPALVLAERQPDFHAGLTCLTRLRRQTAAPVYLCQPPDLQVDTPPGVQVEHFAGPHPAGNAGWHIHRLAPAGLQTQAWHIGYQDVIALGHLCRTGRLDVTRVIALAGSAVRRPRLLRTRLGAAVSELCADEIDAACETDSGVRLISGSVLDGRTAMGAVDGYLGRYHLQVAALPEGRRRELFGWIAPAAGKHSVTGAVLGAFSRAALALTTSTNGAPRAMVPIGSYERVLPFDILPTFLLRALISGDDQRAAELGALELDEDDLALATYVCPGKTDYGPLLRAALTRIERQGV